MKIRKYRESNMISRGSLRVVCLMLCVALNGVASAATELSAYAGQQTRQIKALDAADIQHYLQGKGMGFAKAAELNGYPGPSHVLALSEPLKLSPAQKQHTQEIFLAMETAAKKLGRQIVHEETQLDQLFAKQVVSTETLERSLARIGELTAQLRQTHLVAHIAQRDILTPEQVVMYNKLRGYHEQRHLKPATHHSDAHH